MPPMPEPFETRLPLPQGRELPMFAQVPPNARHGVVVVHEIFGRQPEIDRVVQRFARAGYAAVAPDLFRDRSRFTCLREAMRTMQSGTGPFVDEIRAARAWLCEQAGLAENAVGLIGFCMGGGFALAAGGGFGAVSSNYGDVPATEVMHGIGPVMACYGGRDVLFRGKARVLRDRLAPLGIEPEVLEIPEAGHAFLTDGHHPVASALSRPLMHVEWNPQVAEKAWVQILAFFDRNLLA